MDRRIFAASLLGMALPRTIAFAAGTGGAGNPPTVVLLMRHAEKEEGEAKRSDLSPVGIRRANLLPTLFNRQDMPRPDVIFASDASKHSNRSVETVTPLASALHLRVNHDYSEYEAKALSKELLSGHYGGKTVLVCWHHGELPELAHELGIAEKLKWSDETYDLIWRIEWNSGKPQLTVVHQRLLPGDSTGA
jgi:phosphohistidine phosphatase SixA